MKNLVASVLFCSSLLAGSYQSLLFHGNCITCHDFQSSKSAPSIQEIKVLYMDAFRTKEQFVAYMVNWVYDPQQSTSIMQDAIEKYGLMPHLAYDKQVLEEIADFIYENDFNK